MGKHLLKAVDIEYKKTYQLLAEINMESAFGNFVNKNDVRELLDALGIQLDLNQNY